MRLLVHFHIGGEQTTGEVERAAGLGHARRSVALAQELLGRRAGEVRLVVAGGPTAAAWLDGTGLFYALDADVVVEAHRFRPDAILVDVNYLDADVIAALRAEAPVVNLAARGLPKFLADLTINNTAVLDMPAPPDTRPGPWFRGPRYAIVPAEFHTLRRRMAAPLPPAGRICVLMGGIDAHNMTGSVVDALVAEGASGLAVDVIVGAGNAHRAALEERLATASFPNHLHVAPTDLPALLAGADFGFFGTGTAAEEAMTLGTPAVNLGLTAFHDARGEELAALGAALYLGRADDVAPRRVAQAVRVLRDDPAARAAMVDAAWRIFDGEGCDRAATLVLRWLDGADLAGGDARASG